MTGVSGSGATRTVTVHTGSGDGTIRLDVADDDTIVDLAGNPLGGVGAGNGDFTAGQTYMIDKPPSGAIQVFIRPDQAAQAQTKWRKGWPWRRSGEIEHNVPAGTYAVRFQGTDEWIAPDKQSATIEDGALTVLDATFEKVTAVDPSLWVLY